MTLFGNRVFEDMIGLRISKQALPEFRAGFLPSNKCPFKWENEQKGQGADGRSRSQGGPSRSGELQEQPHSECLKGLDFASTSTVSIRTFVTAVAGDKPKSLASVLSLCPLLPGAHQ